MYNFGEDLHIDDTPSEAMDCQRVTLRMPSKAAEHLELAAYREGMTAGELVVHMLRDYFNKTGI